MGSDGGPIENLEVATFWDFFWRRKSPDLVIENCGSGGWWFGGENQKNGSPRFEELGGCDEHERRWSVASSGRKWGGGFQNQIKIHRQNRQTVNLA